MQHPEKSCDLRRICRNSSQNRTMTFILPSTSPLAPRLLKLASSTTSVLLDRPYGGPGSVEFGAYSSVVLLAGGEGISFVLATLEDLVRKMKAGQCQTKKVQVTWAVKSEGKHVCIVSCTLGELTTRVHSFTALDRRSTRRHRGRCSCQLARSQALHHWIVCSGIGKGRVC